MNNTELQAYLHAHIPLSAAMQVEVREATPEYIELHAPLAPNVNHRGTAFGGSIATLATLAGWSLLRVRLDGMEPLPHLVIQRNTMEFMRPIPGAFSARVHFPADADWPGFQAKLAERGKAKLSLQVEVLSDGAVAARLDGVFVALTV
ncbi:YiiD C-terminal domain-containing protein [Uliginosibacterium sp. 31-12]|uniref:YiiD C-terminal domain-containing protein n=1 Tax=Uliginosibacterium sp. 31-12 TaxID=3062781 RepID=UPI0026E1EBA1|nr:YiiD C-terminal domain-containing protein [Uliginosibacterium sp. 31-12]MDO6384780.1 YiiD C-terminal domain-containing protein [Uliginosibacterium sp. 31-12]